MIADLHIHSKYARATSPKADIEHYHYWAVKKGADILAMPDLTHPHWFNEVKEKVEERDGLLFYKEFPFVPSSEVSFVFNFKGKLRKMHVMVYAEGLDGFSYVNDILSKYGNLEENGRPTVNVPFVEIQDELKGIAFFIPAHIWTPWFSLFGSKFGFDDWRDAIREEGIVAMETGLSSDPIMNRMVSSLDKFSLVSFSDAHSPEKLLREATFISPAELTFKEVMESLRSPVKTYEFYPQEGKYFADGHRNCGVWFYPEEAEKISNTCPVCRRPLTLGVMHRVYKLRDREKPLNVPDFVYVMPLKELIAKALSKSVNSKEVVELYDMVLRYFGGELKVFDAKKDEITHFVDERVRDVLMKFVEGSIYWRPGFDGVFGELSFTPIKKRKSLMDFMN